MDLPAQGAHHPREPERRMVIFMGDKSPKAKDKSKKQHTADKDKKHAAAVDKAKPAQVGAAKKNR